MPKKSRKVLMMMKASKLGWAGAGLGQEQGRVRAGPSRLGAEAGQEQERRMRTAGGGLKQEQDKKWVGAGAG